MDERWIKLFTRLLEWEWHTDPKVLSFWVHALLLAKPVDTRICGILIPRGSFKTKLSELSILTGLSVQEVRTCLNKLQKTGEISVVTTNGNHYITILNYGSYQSVLNKEQQTDNKPTTSEQQTDNKPITNPLYILDIKNKEIKKEQQETTKEQSLFFETWEKCKEYLQSVGAEPITDSGYKRFFLINQIGTGQTKPYGYQDGVKESFELFISRPANRQRYKEREKGQRNPPGSAAPLWQRSPVEFFNSHIGNICKRVSASEAGILNKLQCVGYQDGKLQLKTTTDNLTAFANNGPLKSVWAQEFRNTPINFLT